MSTENLIRASVSGRCVPVRGNDIDTDRIIPARYMKVVSFDGLGEFAFYDERFNSDGRSNSHPFNDEVYKGSAILLVNKNFGCGSSREHAPQSLHRSGIKAVVGESFAEIFEGNCRSMGIPTVTVSSEVIEILMAEVELHPDMEMTVDIKSAEISFNNKEYSLSIPNTTRSSLLEGTWDSTALLLASKEAITAKAAELPYLQEFL